VYDFVLDIDLLKKTAAELNKAVTKLNAIWQTAERVKTNIKHAWVGQSAEAYIEKLAKQNAEFKNYTAKIKELAELLNYIAGEAAKMNVQALSFAGYITASCSSRANAVVSINKGSIKRAMGTCNDLKDIYARQLTKINETASACNGLKYARIIYEREFDTVKTKVKDNAKKIYDLEGALKKYYKDMCLLEEEVCAKFNDVGKESKVPGIAGQIGSGLANILLSNILGISAIVSSVSNIVAPYVRDNYQFNSGFTFSDFIYSQKKDPTASLKMGYFTGDYNGCGWVSTYNAGVILGQDFQPADIIKYFDSRGGALVDGAFGVNPLAIKMYLNSQGIKANLYNLPSNVDERIKDSKVSILMYVHESGGHYIAIEYVGGEYYAYNNDPRWTTTPQPIPSIENWLEENDKYWAAFLITVPEEVTT
jgi:uncharacterized protein YukE